MFGTSQKVKRELTDVQRRYRTLRVPGAFVSYTTKGVVLRPNSDFSESSTTTKSTPKVPRWA